HRRRTAHQQLPAVAGRLRRTLLHRHAVAGHGCGRIRPRTGRIRAPRPPLRTDPRAGARNRSGRRMLKQRTLTALVLAPLAIAAILLLPTCGLALLLAVMSLQALGGG